MTRLRLRPAHDLATLASLYGRPYRSAERGPDHIERMAVTAGLVAGIMRRHQLTSLADLSCGSGEIPKMAAELLRPQPRLWLGDYAAAPGLDVIGPIEETLADCPPVDLFVLSETLEHLDDPDAVLAQIGTVARWLVLTTPIGERDDANPEHYWGWDLGDLLAMLSVAGWRARTSGVLEPEPGYYRFQLWACSRRQVP